MPARFLQLLGALVGLGGRCGGGWGSRRSPGGGALLGLCWCWCRPSCRHLLLHSLLQPQGRAPALPVAAVGSGVAQLRPGTAQQPSWGLCWGCAWALRGGCEWGMRRGDGIFVGTGAWGLAGALVELVGGLVGLSSCFSLPVVASFAPGGGRLWVPRWSAGSPNHDGPSAAIGCTGAISFAPATSPRVIGRQPRPSGPFRRDSCLLAASCKSAATE